MQVLKPTFKPRPIAEAKGKRYVHAIIYGYPGSRKTTLAETAPGPRLWLNCDPSGTHVINWDDPNNLLPPHPDTNELIDVFNHTRGSDWKLLLRVLQTMEAVGPDLSEAVGTVVLDTGTYAAKMFDQYLLEDTTVKRPSEDKLSLADFGTHAAVVGRTIARLCALPCNIVINAHVTDKRFTDETGADRTLELPNFIGQQVPAEAPGMFDLVGFLRVAPSKDGKTSGTSVLQVEHGEGRVAKVRARKELRFPPNIENPNLSDIFGQILGQSTKESA